MEDINYTMATAHSPQTGYSLRIDDDVKHCDTTQPCSLTINQRTV